jgi:hypothetical protein
VNTATVIKIQSNSGASASGNPKGLSRPVERKLYLFYAVKGNIGG